MFIGEKIKLPNVIHIQNTILLSNFPLAKVSKDFKSDV